MAPDNQCNDTTLLRLKKAFLKDTWYLMIVINYVEWKKGLKCKQVMSLMP